MIWLALFACKSPATEQDTGPAPFDYPSLEEGRPALRGAGGPSVAFSDDALFENCAFLPGSENDRGHRNTVVPWRGHMIVPWAHEVGFGGLSFWDMSDPCNPSHDYVGEHLNMRETHALSMVHLPEGDPFAGDYAVANGTLGLVFWNMTDLDAVEGTYIIVDGVVSLDSYARTAFSVFWQYPYVYLASTDNGLIILDATNPAEPFEVNRFQLDPILRMGGITINGNRALVVSAGEKEAAIFDLSDPIDPQLVNRFDITDAEGVSREAYGGTMYGDFAAFARKDAGSGPILFDISDPLNPTFHSEVHVEGSGGGYIFFDEGYAFIGQTNRADVYDFNDSLNPVHVGRGDLHGDLDTFTPFGNVGILAVDDEGIEDEEMAVMPWMGEPDTSAPEVLVVNPQPGSIGVATTARIGIGFDEMIEPSSVFPGSVQVRDANGQAVEGWAGAHEAFGWFTPKEPLQPDTEYTVTVVAGGAADVNGNTLADDVVSTFTTGSM